jgi:hypothetical protein
MLGIPEPLIFHVLKLSAANGVGMGQGQVFQFVIANRAASPIRRTYNAVAPDALPDIRERPFGWADAHLA